MVLWILMAMMAGAAALAVLWPLRVAASEPVSNAADGEVDVYKAHLAEIERDHHRGLIGEAEAEGLRAEAARRLLRHTDVEAARSIVTTGSDWRRRMAALFILAALPVGGLGVYLKLGSPQLPDVPLATRGLDRPEQLDIQNALARIERHLESNPTDLRGWDLIAPIYLRMGRPRDAARAFESAIRNGGNSAERWASLGEARMVAEEGMVTASARAAFEEALKLEPGYPKAAYGMAVARQQDGDVAGAISSIEALIATAAPDAAYLPLLKDSLAALQGRPAVPSSQTAQPVIPQGGEAIASLPPPERINAIRSMVDGLAARLDAQGGTLEEWTRLIRARLVLEDRAGAQTAFHAAIARLAPDAASLEKLKALGRELDLKEPQP
ncbi:MAG: c-type cytochrome biogenesis protein CcmI [Bosea sp. (in: a-proteobacteria)]